MSDEDLLYLKRIVVDRLYLRVQASSPRAVAQFAEVDRVEFTTQDGQTLEPSVNLKS
jgi:hypothetical protein